VKLSTDHHLGFSGSVARRKVSATVAARVLDVLEVIEQVWDTSQTEEKAHDNGQQTDERR
jgi:hypothetical protein